MVNNEYIYALQTTGLKYPAKDGAVLDASNIILYSPTTRTLRFVAPLKQTFMRCIASQGNKLTAQERAVLAEAQAQRVVDKDEQDVELTGDLMIASLASSSDVDYPKFLEQFIDVLKQPELARIDGEMPVTASFIDKLPFSELEALAGEYLVNFTAASVLKG